MHICLISVEIFAFGKYGGFGRSTRMLGRELSTRGIKVSAVVPLRPGQDNFEILDGIRVYGFAPKEFWNTGKLFEKINADIYHSQEPSFGTYQAKKSMPDKKHIVTFRDPRNINDWIIEFRNPTLSQMQVVSNWLYEDNWLVKRAAQRANKTFVAAKFLKPIVKRKYNLQSDPGFLPSPVYIPAVIHKSPEPCVAYIARLDRRKRPEIFLDLAKNFPQISFIAAGQSRDQKYDQFLKEKYSQLPNLEMTGFINQFESERLAQIFEKSWIYVNTAAREGLPTAFIEACGYKNAILSSVDPDGFSSQYGYHAKDDQFVEGLRYLLTENRWIEKAEKGYQYVSSTFQVEKSIEKHLEIYSNLMNTN